MSWFLNQIYAGSAYIYHLAIETFSLLCYIPTSHLSSEDLNWVHFYCSLSAHTEMFQRDMWSLFSINAAQCDYYEICCKVIKEQVAVDVLKNAYYEAKLVYSWYKQKVDIT